VTGGLATIGVRVPNHPVALAILQAVGVRLATTSVTGRVRKRRRPERSRKMFWFESGMDDRWRGVRDPGSVFRGGSVLLPFTVKRQGAIAKLVLEQTLFQ